MSRAHSSHLIEDGVRLAGEQGQLTRALRGPCMVVILGLPRHFAEALRINIAAVVSSACSLLFLRPSSGQAFGKQAVVLRFHHLVALAAARFEPSAV